MAINPEARRSDGVSPLNMADVEGSRGADGRGVHLPTATYHNPGPTPNLLGIEPNTSWDRGSSEGEPMIDTEPAGPVPRGVPFDTPDDSLGDTVGTGDPKWGGPGASAANSRPTEIPHDSFSAFGETYPTNGGLDGRT